MASLYNNNSSSSPPIPNRPNPKPRNSEAGDPLRRSFKDKPFPANSKVNIPSDFSRRNSFGGDKENENKAVQTPKGSKNFMLPTISAVSKINASPRKKVLSDKNEMSRSFSDIKGSILEDTKSHHHRAKSCVSFSDVIHTICIDEKKHFEESHDMTVTDYDEGITYSDPRFRISPRPSVAYTSPEFAACEVDKLLPPYDPKKNYLSPRPQFLHYKPNPRVERRFDECKQLEELFISESSSSDTELSVEESEEQEKNGAEAVVEEETEDVKQRFDECNQLEELFISESSSSETVEESEKFEEQDKNGAEAVVEQQTEDVEQLEAESDDKEMVCESIEEASQVPKQSGFRRVKFLGWFLALALGLLLVSATFSPPAESRVYEFHIPKEIAEFAKANNLEQWSEKLCSLTESSLVYIDKLISYLGGGETKFGPLQFHNLTYTLEDETVFQPTRVEINEEPLQEKSVGENNLGDVYREDGSVNEFEEESGIEEKSEVVSETQDADAEANEFDEQTDMKPGTDIELNEDEGNLKVLLKDGVELNIEEQREFEVSPEDNDDVRGSQSQEKLETGSSVKESEDIYINQHDVESAAINVHQPKESEVADAQSGEIAAEPSDDLQLKLWSSNKADNELVKAVAESGSEASFEEIAAENSDDLHPKVSSPSKNDNDLSKAMIVLSSTVLVLLAVSFLFTMKPKHVAAATPEPTPKTTEELNLTHMPVENLLNDKLSSLNFEDEVDDRISCSFNKKSSFYKDPQSEVGKKSNTSSSKLRRESMASSASEYSVGSFSYGSFTTYEKIPIKTGDREEEMVTPVRRSSRIRNKQ